MTDHFLAATLLALTIFAAHLAGQNRASTIRYRVDNGPILSSTQRSLNLTRLPSGRHTIVLELP